MFELRDFKLSAVPDRRDYGSYALPLICGLTFAAIRQIILGFLSSHNAALDLSVCL